MMHTDCKQPTPIAASGLLVPGNCYCQCMARAAVHAAGPPPSLARALSARRPPYTRTQASVYMSSLPLKGYKGLCAAA
jgi:hypothetical protein